ncbi:MAG: cytochrome c biogenesis protein CcsA [Candidatus Zixiibacteriota bacterium]
MSLANLGDVFIYGATILIAGAAISYAQAWRGRQALQKPARALFIGGAGCLVAASVVLMTLILQHDFSVSYVANYSSTDLPLHYLISTFWGGQEGTFLLWLMYIGIMGVVLMYTAGKKYEYGALFYLSLVSLSILVIILKKSPFETLPFTPAEGSGLNPLLQNYWMVIHPPTMFVGFAAAAFPFVFALTALSQRSYDDWAEKSRRWTLFAWLALGIALVEGGYWAYETLGWGGFWAWDPVENSSFIPWIFLTTQVHSTFIRKQRGGLMRFSLFMVCLTFLSVLYGTFLTRSGVLADFSVHSFVDLGINNFLIGGLFFFMFVTGALFMWRWSDIRSGSSFTTVASRSYVVTLGIVVLFLGGILTLLGTSAPILTRFTDTPSAVGLNYYQITMNPIAISILALLTLFPTFKWDSGLQRKWVLLVAGGVAVLTYINLLTFANIPSQTYLIILSLAPAAVWVNGYFLWLRTRGRYIASPYLIHVGLAVLLVGATVSAGLESGAKVILPRGEEVHAMGHHLTFTGINRDGIYEQQYIQITDADGGAPFLASTGSRLQVRDNSVMRTPHVEQRLLYDIYLAPLAVETMGDPDPGLLTFSKGQSQTLGKYEFTFTGFEVSSHGDDGQTANRAEALLTVTYDGKKENVRPALIVQQTGLQPVTVPFDGGAGEIHIESIDAESGSVALIFAGDFVPARQNPLQLVLVVEMTFKPLINLFWLGSILIFIGGTLSLTRGTQKRKEKRTERLAQPSSEPQRQFAAS